MSTGLMWCRFEVLEMTRAAEFCTPCSLAVRQLHWLGITVSSGYSCVIVNISPCNCCHSPLQNKLHWRVIRFLGYVGYRLATHDGSFSLGGWGVNQAYSRLSTTHGHITDCKLDSVVYAGVCVWVNVDLSCLGRTIYTRQFLGASHRFNSATGEPKWITQTSYTDSEPPSRLPNSLRKSRWTLLTLVKKSVRTVKKTTLSGGGGGGGHFL